MKKTVRKNRKRRFLAALCALLLIVSACFAVAAEHLPSRFPSQSAAERWRGENELEFAQVSCFMPLGSGFDVETAYSFRYDMIKALTDASLDPNGDSRLWDDAWSTAGKVTAVSSLGSGEMSVTAVGGDYFNFHPLQLVSGSYIGENDVMRDRVLLDREAAWLLFGSADVEGLSLEINGVSFVAAGVVERESDRISRLAYSDGMGIYMSYDAFLQLNETAEISCYEFVLAEPVKGFARSTAEASFPVKKAEIVDNSYRFDALNSMKPALDPFARAMQKNGVLYPYWENAARYAETLCGTLRIWAAALILIPAAAAIWFVVSLLRRGKEALEDRIIPEAKENVEEKIRVVQRRRWEKYHGKH